MSHYVNSITNKPIMVFVIPGTCIPLAVYMGWKVLAMSMDYQGYVIN
jgi:hypothetical protein